MARETIKDPYEDQLKRDELAENAKNREDAIKPMLDVLRQIKHVNETILKVLMQIRDKLNQ